MISSISDFSPYFNTDNFYTFICMFKESDYANLNNKNMFQLFNLRDNVKKKPSEYKGKTLTFNINLNHDAPLNIS